MQVKRQMIPLKRAGLGPVNPKSAGSGKIAMSFGIFIFHPTGRGNSNYGIQRILQEQNEIWLSPGPRGDLEPLFNASSISGTLPLTQHCSAPRTHSGSCVRLGLQLLPCPRRDLGSVLSGQERQSGKSFGNHSVHSHFTDDEIKPRKNKLF